MNRERLTTWLLLAMTFAVRAIHPGQPIVENYVGRQVPTAMVARNLERGSGFLHPTLDTGPFPNLFLVEPPIYARVVASARIFGFDWETTGQLASVMGAIKIEHRGGQNHRPTHAEISERLHAGFGKTL